MSSTRLARAGAVLAALVLGAGLLAACGDDEEGDDATSEYGQQLRAVLGPVEEERATLAATISAAADDDELVERLGESESKLRDGAAQLVALDVPAAAADINAELVAAIDDFADELAGLREVAESGSRGRLEDAILDALDAASELERELTDLSEAAAEAGVPIDDPEEG